MYLEMVKKKQWCQVMQRHESLSIYQFNSLSLGIIQKVQSHPEKFDQAENCCQV